MWFFGEIWIVDISVDNMVDFSKVGNVCIEYLGKGEL